MDKQASFNAAASSDDLVAAIDRGDSLKAVAQLLNRGADPEKPDSHGRKPMDAAMERDWYKVADMLIHAGAKPPPCEGPANGPIPYDGPYEDHKRELQRETALTYCLKKHNGFRAIYLFLANGADVNLPNKDGKTPLAIAERERPWHYAAVQLVKRGAWMDPAKPDPDEVIDRPTGASRLLSVVLEGEDALAVQAILKQGADPNKADDNGLTPLAAARALNWGYVEKLLLDAGAKPDVEFPDPNQSVGGKKTGTPLLHYTVSGQCCHPNYQLALIDAGADLDAKGADGRAAVHWAAIYGRTWFFEELQAAGADVVSACEQQQLTPMHYACMNNRYDIAACIAAAHPEACLAVADGSKQTPLHMAADRKGSARLVKLLLDNGADINARDKRGYTPLHHAVESHDVEMVRILLERGAAVDAANEGKECNPPLFHLANNTSDEAEKVEIARLLLKNGASPHVRATQAINGPSKDDSLLYYSIRYHTHKIARELLKAGADPHDTDYRGSNAMHHCLHLRDIKGCKLLLEFGFDPLRPTDFTEVWSGGTVKRYCGSAYDEAKALVKQFGHDREYGTMLDIIEEHLSSPKPKKAPAPKRRAAT